MFLSSSSRPMSLSPTLDYPEKYGFQEDDVTQESGAIWADELHFTSNVHAILAERIEQALRTVDCAPDVH